MRSHCAFDAGVFTLQFAPVAEFAIGALTTSDPVIAATASATSDLRVRRDVILSTFPEG